MVICKENAIVLIESPQESFKTGRKASLIKKFNYYKVFHILNLSFITPNLLTTTTTIYININKLQCAIRLLKQLY